MTFLKAQGTPFRTVEYEYDASVDNLALAAAAAIGLPPECVLKTLMVRVDQVAVCVVVAANRTLSMKRVAAASQGKSAALLEQAKAERLTGYRVGGISPFGQKLKSQTFIDSAAMQFDEVAVNGGRRGLLVLIQPGAMQTVLAATVADLSS